MMIRKKEEMLQVLQLQTADFLRIVRVYLSLCTFCIASKIPGP